MKIEEQQKILADFRKLGQYLKKELDTSTKDINVINKIIAWSNLNGKVFQSILDCKFFMEKKEG